MKHPSIGFVWERVIQSPQQIVASALSHTINFMKKKSVKMGCKKRYCVVCGKQIWNKKSVAKYCHECFAKKTIEYQKKYNRDYHNVKRFEAGAIMIDKVKR